MAYPFDDPFTEQQAIDMIAPGGYLPGASMSPAPMQPQGGGFDAFMRSPGLALAGQAVNNMFQLRRDQAPRVSPIMAMQNAMRQNDALMLRKARILDARREMQRRAAIEAEKQRISADPFYDYEQFRERYPEQAEGVSLQDFYSMQYRSADPGSHAKSLGVWFSVNPQREGETDQEYQERAAKALETIVRAPSYQQMGGGGVQRFGAFGGPPTTVVDPTQATLRDAARARAEAMERALGATAAERSTNANTALNNISQTFDVIDQINTDTFDSIYGQARGLLPVVGQEAVDTWAKIEQLTGRLTFEERKKLKGQGTITDRESDALGRSVQVLGNRRISPRLARREIQNIENILGDSASMVSGYIIPETPTEEKDDINI